MSDTEGAEAVRLNQIIRDRIAEQTERARTGTADDLQRIIRERAAMASPADPETRLMVHSTELGEPGLPDAWVRARVAVADTREERQAAFSEVYPFGEIRPARDEQGQTFDIYRRDPGEAWRKFDPPIMERFEPVQDIADFASAALPVAGEIATTRGTGGLVRRTLQTAAGAAGGEAVEEALEAAGGQQRQPLGDVATQVGGEALTAGLGSLATEPLAYIVNAFRGGGIALRPGAPEAIAAAERQGLPPIMPFQAARDPIIRTMGGQARALASSIEEFAEKQEVAAATRLRELTRAAGDPEVLPMRLRTRVNAAQGELDNILERPGVELEAGGEALQQGLREYDQLARAEVNDLYAAAREIEEPTFQIDDLKLRAQTALDESVILTGTEAERTARPMAPMGAELRKALQDIVAFDGNPRTVELSDGSAVTLSATDQLRAIRESLWDAKTVDRGVIPRRPEADAAHFYNEITKALETPEGSPEFLEAWETATSAASDRFTTWDRAVIRTTDKNEDPVDLAYRFMQPRQVVQLRTLRETIPAENWRTFQASVKEQFLGDPSNLTRRLDEFDQPTLNMLVPFREQAALRQIGQGYDRMVQAEGLAQMARYQDIANRVVGASDGQTVTSLTETIGGPNSPEGKALRAALLNNISDAVIDMQQGIPTLNRDGLQNIIQKMEQNGSSRFLTDADRQALNDLDRYMDLVKGVPDVGTSLMRASIVKQLRELSAKAAFDIMQAFGVGRLMVTPQGRRFLMGAGQDKLSFNSLRLLGAATATIAADTEALGREEE